MPRIAITGHMNLTQDSASLVAEAVADALAEYPPQELTGISCIARGADSIFAQAVLDSGARLEVVLPSAHYREKKVKPDHAAQFDKLVSHATIVQVMPYDEPNREAYEAANDVLLSTCDVLFAVWDGRSGTDKGSTASVVAQARALNVPVHVIWPDGAARE